MANFINTNIFKEMIQPKIYTLFSPADDPMFNEICKNMIEDAEKDLNFAMLGESNADIQTFHNISNEVKANLINSSKIVFLPPKSKIHHAKEVLACNIPVITLKGTVVGNYLTNVNLPQYVCERKDILKTIYRMLSKKDIVYTRKKIMDSDSEFALMDVLNKIIDKF